MSIVILNGTALQDTLIGVAGRVNKFVGGGGNDSISGRNRADIAVYSGVLSDYTVAFGATGSITVTDKRFGSPDGIDTLTGINLLEFSDGLQFYTQVANRVRMRGTSTSYQVSNSDYVTGTTAGELFVIGEQCSASIDVSTGDIVDFSRPITDYTFRSKNTVLQVSDGLYTTFLTYGDSFILRTASGSTVVSLSSSGGLPVFKFGTQTVGAVGFDPLLGVGDAVTVSSNAGKYTRLMDTTVDELNIVGLTLDSLRLVGIGANILSGSASPNATVSVYVNGVTNPVVQVTSDQFGVWSVTLPLTTPTVLGMNFLRIEQTSPGEVASINAKVYRVDAPVGDTATDTLGDDYIDFTGVSIGKTFRDGQGDDIYRAGSGNDTTVGILSDEANFAARGDNTFFGGAGNDTFIALGSSDRFFGGSGTDTAVIDASYSSAAYQLTRATAEQVGSAKLLDSSVVSGVVVEEVASGSQAFLWDVEVLKFAGNDTTIDLTLNPLVLPT